MYSVLHGVFYKQSLGVGSAPGWPLRRSPNKQLFVLSTVQTQGRIQDLKSGGGGWPRILEGGWWYTSSALIVDACPSFHPF